MTEEVAKLVSEKYPKKSDKFIQYGTAGFRTKAEDLPHVLCRMGLLAVLRSKQKQSSIGAMITASHNPEEDNGVKLIDPLGEMLEKRWEEHATLLANASDDHLAETLNSIMEQEKIDMEVWASVLFARDTRASSKSLAEALQFGVEALTPNFQDFGLLTTPQLHYLVRCKNTVESYGIFSEEGYYKKLAGAFVKLHKEVEDTGKYSSEVFVDAANGVGAEKLKHMQNHVGEALTIHVINDGSTGQLNYKVGADYVKVSQCVPEGLELKEGMKCASLDGDGDRIVYYFKGQDGSFNLLDGDRIATLVAGFLKRLVERSGLDLNLGLVQTAYANGSSTKYITDSLQVPVACVATGVKHLHHKAQEFDIGVYFEANGHGTVLFSENAENKIKGAANDVTLPDEQKKATETLRTTVDLINQTVGDAISDLLLVEMILRTQGWDMDTWFQCYTDLPNRQSKVKVKDRTVILTTEDETKATNPEGLQAAIDDVVSKYTSARSFVRPSGTEDIVRVYAEADTQEAADSLAQEVSRLVYDMAGGIGDQP